MLCNSEFSEMTTVIENIRSQVYILHVFIFLLCFCLQSTHMRAVSEFFFYRDIMLLSYVRSASFKNLLKEVEFSSNFCHKFINILGCLVTRFFHYIFFVLIFTVAKYRLISASHFVSFRLSPPS